MSVRCCATLIMAVALTGCSTLPDGSDISSGEPADEGVDISTVRKQRHGEAVLRFKSQRVAAELADARSRWALGDLPGCLDVVERILEHEPGNEAARELHALILGTNTAGTVDGASGIPSLIEQFFGPPKLEVPPQRFANVAPESIAGLTDAINGETVSADTMQSAQADSQLRFASPREPGAGITVEQSRPRAAAFSIPFDDQRTTGPGHFAGSLQNSGPLPAVFSSTEPALLPATTSAEADKSEEFVPVKEPADSEFSASDSFLANADRAFREDDLDTARQYLQAALDANPHDQESAISTLVLPLRHGHPDLTIELAKTVTERFDDTSAVYRTVGVAYYRQGDFESSQIALQQALSLDNGHPLTYFLLGHTLAKLGDGAAAQGYFRQARRASTVDER